MQRASVDLPQPVSPTRPRVSPFFTSRETPSTAWTTSREWVGNSFRTSSTFSSALLIHVLASLRARMRLERAVLSDELASLVHDATASLTVWGSQHADWCRGSPPTSASGGVSARHLSNTYGHRPANGHPAGRLIRLGGLPGIGVSRSPLRVGSEARSPCV